MEWSPATMGEVISVVVKEWVVSRLGSSGEK